MGARLDQYLSSFGQALSQLGASQQQQPPTSPTRGRRGQGPTSRGQPTAAGAQTFPTEGPGAQPGTPLEVSEPTFTEPQAPTGGRRGRNAAGGNTFEPTVVEAAPAPAFDQGPAPAQVSTEGLPPQGSMAAEDVKTPEDLFAAADEEDIRKGVDVLEQQLESEGSSVDEAYQKVTGEPPDTRLTREEKGQLLMEFGLGILAQNPMEGEGLAAIGASGLSTMQSARAMKEAKRTAPAEERKAQLEMDLTEAQISAANRQGKEITTNDAGNMIIVDTNTGNTIEVTDSDGNPVTGGVEDQRRFEKEVARDMYRAVRCTGLDGEALKTCETAALAYASGGPGTTLAFPEIMDRENTEAALRVLLDEDAQYTRHLIPSTGEEKTIRDMNSRERAEVVREYAQMWGVDPEQAEGEADAPIGWDHPNVRIEGFTSADYAQIPPGQKYPHPDGGFVVNRDGTMIRLDENNQEMGAE